MNADITQIVGTSDAENNARTNNNSNIRIHAAPQSRLTHERRISGNIEVQLPMESPMSVYQNGHIEERKQV